ncbi:CarboxypepD_reg-like domain-containing protein [Arenibacter troitsensis]|uniref:CarboxypepD_reg-like domain-containing protein n=2 Tax=Arenibacter troitsensis TaxID=188872 RepID=A0A1X7K6L9_9FLAO|nr:CarboxypepD_reg-like domain-containing protein [Arenibacter troitsensis]
MRIVPIYLVFIIYSVFAQALMAQDFSKILEGKVYSDDGDVAATHVLNTTTKKAAITDINGFFSIAVSLGDTLVFSAVQYKRKEMVVNTSILESKFLSVPLEESNIALDEVIVMPYNLTGELGRDMNNMDVGTVISATSLGLPNAHVKPLMQSERLLREASMGPLSIGMLTSIPFNPIINAISGRTKMLKKRVARDIKYNKSQQIRTQFADSLFVLQLKIPMEKIDDFLYFCEVDTNFNAVVDSQDLFAIWEFIKQKSVIYRKNNGLE